jgi:hypothetical protein
MVPLKPGEEVKGLVADPVRKTYWAYTSLSLYELSAKNEDRDVWRIYLEKGNHELALKYAKASNFTHIFSQMLTYLVDCRPARPRPRISGSSLF